MRHFLAFNQRLRLRGLWLRGLIWLLAVCVPLQTTATLTTNLLEPAHVHGPMPRTAHDPMLDMVRLVHDHHDSRPLHHHDQVERHHHDAAADVGDVTLVGDDDADTHAPQNTDGQRTAGDQPASLDSPVPASTHRAGAARPAERSCHFSSHVGGLPERPPR